MTLAAIMDQKKNFNRIYQQTNKRINKITMQMMRNKNKFYSSFSL